LTHTFIHMYIKQWTAKFQNFNNYSSQVKKPYMKVCQKYWYDPFWKMQKNVDIAFGQ
jgi:hypothetical protein